MNALENGKLGTLCLQEAHYATLGEIHTRLNLHKEICGSVERYLHAYFVKNTVEALTNLDRIAAWGE